MRNKVLLAFFFSLLFNFVFVSAQVKPVPEGWKLPPVHYDSVMPEFTYHMALLRKCFQAEEGITTVKVLQDSVTFKWDVNAITFSYSYKESEVIAMGIITPASFAAGISYDSGATIIVLPSVKAKEIVLSELKRLLEELGCLEK